MSKSALIGFILPLLLLFTSFEAVSRNPTTKNSLSDQLQLARRSLDEGGTGRLQKMIVENGSVTMDLDVNRLNGIKIGNGKLEQVQFAVATNSFFSILVFNDLLRGPEQGSMALLPQNDAAYGFPVSISASLKQLAVEKLPADAAFDLAVRDAKTGFTFFNIEGHQYDYDADAQLLSIHGGRLLISNEFAKGLGRSADAGVAVGHISIGATMQTFEITQLVNGEIKSVVMPPLHGAASGNTPTLVSGPDVIVGDLPQVAQGGNDTLVGVDIGTTPVHSTLIGDAQTLSDSARGGDDRLISRTGDDAMWGDAQAMLGSAQGGNDMFVFDSANGHDSIGDFGQGGSNLGTDHIDVTALGIHDFSELNISAFDPSAHESTITFSTGNDVIVHSESALTQQDFLFA